ncbi:MAG TPA: hypothetical protein VMM54_11775 [Nitrospirota bacterium]|nr:hypothetical protein [Nitrospirota bacterium]
MTVPTTGLSIIEQWHQECEWTRLPPVVLLIIGDLRSIHPRRTLSVKGSVCGKLSLSIKSNCNIMSCGFIPIVIGSITSKMT